MAGSTRTPPVIHDRPVNDPRATSTPVIKGADLNHVALAAEVRTQLAARYGAELRGRTGPEGPGPGFWWAQLEYANGMLLEMLEPHHPEENDFLRRFLDRNGPGPHHLTYTVPDFASALDAVHDGGYRPVGVNDSDPDWKEAFLHPKDIPGVVVQLAETHEHHPDPLEDDDGVGPRPEPATLVHVCHAVREMAESCRLFEGLLGGRRVGEGRSDDHEWIELAWPGPGRVRLISPTGAGPIDSWLGSRAGRIHHVAFRMPDPGAVSGAARVGGVWHVEPADNLGTRLVLLEERS